MKKKKIELAEQEIVKNFVPQLEEIISLFDIELDECLITDESLYSDFEGLEAIKERVAIFKEKYGFVPESSQYLYEIAQKMVCKRKN